MIKSSQNKQKNKQTNKQVTNKINVISLYTI